MGAQTFDVIGQGRTVAEAFRQARDHALYMEGHGGYTGSIAEKHEFTELRAPVSMTDDERVAYALELLDQDDKRFSDKWGPAGAIRLADSPGGVRRWLFFGVASS